MLPFLKFLLPALVIAIRPTVAMFCSFGIFLAFLSMQPWVVVALMFLYIGYFFSWSAGKTLE